MPISDTTPRIRTFGAIKFAAALERREWVHKLVKRAFYVLRFVAIFLAATFVLGSILDLEKRVTVLEEIHGE